MFRPVYDAVNNGGLSYDLKYNNCENMILRIKAFYLYDYIFYTASWIWVVVKHKITSSIESNDYNYPAINNQLLS